MKGIRGFLAIFVLLSSSPVIADDWDTYAQWWTGHYYEFDPKTFTSISCEADSSLLDEGMAALLAPHHSVTASEAHYSVTVSNDGHVDVSDPSLQLKLVDPSRAAEASLVGEMVRPRYTALAASIGYDIKSLVKQYTPPSRKNSAVEKFVVGKDSVSLVTRYLDEGNTATVTFRGPEVTGETIQKTTIAGYPVEATGSVKQHFDTVDGRYLLASWEEDSQQNVAGRQVHNMSKVTVGYQLISGIRFPGVVTWASQQGSDTAGMDNTVEFKDCKVTK